MVVEHRLSSPEGVLLRPDSPCGTGVLVLGGSSGRVDDERARLLAEHGALAMSVQWFGGEGQQPAPYEVPLEQLTVCLDALAGACKRLAVVGVSFGAELALVLASGDPRVRAAVAFAPSSVVWAGVAADGPHGEPRQTSHWSLDGHPLPFVPLSESWRPETDPPAFRGLYSASLAERPDRAEVAVIPVERIGGDVVLVSGDDDQVWPSVDFARRIEARRIGYGLVTTVVTHRNAGHRTVLPGESPVVAGMAMQRGGTPESDAELGRWAWPHVARALHLRA
ncbi:MAG: acyl-CoA thioesterase [Actinomycetota bacterium]|nr:acyl-CoA thioesterase [Actinomycetota bacterium]